MSNTVTVVNNGEGGRSGGFESSIQTPATESGLLNRASDRDAVASSQTSATSATTLLSSDADDGKKQSSSSSKVKANSKSSSSNNEISVGEMNYPNSGGSAADEPHEHGEGSGDASGVSVGIKQEDVPDNDKIKDKKGRSTSCFLCQKRKQKCDQRFPSCTNCLKSKFQCIQPPRYGENNNTSGKSNDYTKFLEKKIKQLEKLLDLKAKNKLNDMKNNRTKRITLNDEKILKYKKISPYIDGEEGGSCDAGAGGRGRSNSSSVSSTSDTDDYNSDVSLINQPYATFMSINASAFKNSVLKNYNLNDFIKFDPILNIDQKFSKNLIGLYFRMLQYKFPLLNEREIFEFSESYYENKKQQQPLSDEEFNVYHFKCSRMFFIYAISALLYKSTGKYKGPNPFNFFSTALRHLILLSNNVEAFNKIELLILICFFLIRADKNSNNLYLIISDAMQCCMHLSLHKSKSYENIDSNLKDLKMRKFWCCYILERSILISISKPFILHERRVDSKIPLFNYEPSQAFNPNNGKIFFINQSIKIKRLESRFIEELSIVTASSKSINKNQLVKVERFFQELQNWRNECQGFNNNGIENQTLLFYYYKSIRHLIQPYLELLDPNDKLFKECQAAAGQICQSIKNYHAKTFYGFSILNIHLVFIAGITLIYCLWLQRNRDDMRRKLLGDDKKHTRPTVSEDLFRGLDDLRACSISLYVMSERTKFALSFRDTFEEIMNATIGNLILRCGPDSSEILYRGIGLPPAIFRKPLKHFQIESNYIEKSDADKLEDEERQKRKGHLTRSAIPKGLSHLLLHPPGLEDYDQKDNEKDRERENQMRKVQQDLEKERKRESESKEREQERLRQGETQREQEKEKENEKEQEREFFRAEQDRSDLNNRILPLPIKLPQLQPQTRLTSSLNSKSFDNEIRLASGNPYAMNNLSLKRKYSKCDSETDSVVSSLPSNVLSPLVGSTFKSSLNTPALMSSSLNTAVSNSATAPNNELSSTSTMSDKFRYLRSPLNPNSPNIVNNTAAATITSSSSPDTSSPMSTNVMSDNLVMQNTIPDLIPFVGGTTNMISNISTWTEQSGQQVPQTGLTMLQYDSHPNPNELSFSHNMSPANLGQNHNNHSHNLAHPHHLNNNNNYPQSHLPNSTNSMSGYQSMGVHLDGSHNGNGYGVYNNTNNNNNSNGDTYNQNTANGSAANRNNGNGMDSNKSYPPQYPSQPNNGMTETFNSLFDVVGNDDFWGLNNDLGFLP